MTESRQQRVRDEQKDRRGEKRKKREGTYHSIDATHVLKPGDPQRIPDALPPVSRHCWPPSSSLGYSCSFTRPLLMLGHDATGARGEEVRLLLLFSILCSRVCCSNGRARCC